MQTPDGARRVEAAGARTASWYRMIHDGISLDWLTLGDVERVLTGAGIDLSDLREAPPRDG